MAIDLDYEKWKAESGYDYVEDILDYDWFLPESWTTLTKIQSQVKIHLMSLIDTYANYYYDEGGIIDQFTDELSSTPVKIVTDLNTARTIWREMLSYSYDPSSDLLNYNSTVGKYIATYPLYSFGIHSAQHHRAINKSHRADELTKAAVAKANKKLHTPFNSQDLFDLFRVCSKIVHYNIYHRALTEEHIKGFYLPPYVIPNPWAPLADLIASGYIPLGISSKVDEKFFVIYCSNPKIHVSTDWLI